MARDMGFGTFHKDEALSLFSAQNVTARTLLDEATIKIYLIATSTDEGSALGVLTP